MQYMLLIYGDPGVWESRSEAEESALYEEYGRLGRDLRAQNKLRDRRGAPTGRDSDDRTGARGRRRRH